MVKIGFVVEDDAMRLIIESTAFTQFLESLGIEPVGVFSADGRDWFRHKNEKIKSFMMIFQQREADFIYFLMDLEADSCITISKDKIYKYTDNQVSIIVVKAIESWFLADSKTLSSIFNQEYYYSNPELMEAAPFDILREEFISLTGRGIGKRRNLHTKMMISNGFSVVNSASHTECRSAKYFINSLKENRNKV